MLFLVVFGILRPDTYLTETTFKLVFSEGVVTATLALAFLIPMAAGAYDLSVGAMMSLALGITTYLSIHSGLPPAACAAVAILACSFVGIVTGFIVVRLRVNSFIATLGISQALLAIVLLISDNRQITGAFPQSYLNLGTADVGPIPGVVLFLFVLAVVVWYVLEHTPAGRYLFAVGANADAARLSGVRSDYVVWLSLVASAALASFAGVIISMRTGIFSSSIGPGYLFPAITAVFLGASQFSRRPNVWGTLIAYFALAFGIKGLQLVSGSGGFWVQPLFEAAALIFAVAFASAGPRIGRRRGGKSSPVPAAQTNLP
ncbi:MAG: ABC transporter permease [Solirubrobacterales bacterium]